MRKRMAVLMAAGALAAGMLACGLAVRSYVGMDTERYPGAQVVGGQDLPAFSLASPSIERKGTYQTADALAPVRAWYAQRLQVLATDNVTAGPDCASMSRSRHVVIFEYSASVLLCTAEPGTRITLSQSVALGQ